MRARRVGNVSLLIGFFVTERAMQKIFVLGSINMDLVVNAAAWPQQGETLTAQSFFSNPGGKGANQAVAVAQSFGTCQMAGAVGQDAYGPVLLSALQKKGVCTQKIAQKAGSSGVAVILVAEGDNRILVSPGANGSVGKAEADALLCDAERGDIFLTQAEIPLPTVVYALQLAKKKGMYTVFNPAPANEKLCETFAYVDLLIPNETELMILTQRKEESFAWTEESLKQAYAQLKAKGISELMVTLGKQGAVYINGDTLYTQPAFRVQAVDTTAAGDTFCGAYVSALAMGEDVFSAMRFAVAASALAVQRAGAQESIPTREETEAFLCSMYTKE